MAINVVNITQVSNELGFTPWTWIPLLHSSTLDTISSIPYTKIPSNLTPAAEFQVAAETSTCSLIAPWGGFDGAFTEFLTNGGTTGTVLGALNGLNIIEQSFLQQTTANYGFGQQYLGPELGYCIGTHFKEKIYTTVNAQYSPEGVTPVPGQQSIPGTFVGETNEELIWRSRWERFYVNHGTINSFDELDGETRITVLTNATNSSVGEVDLSEYEDRVTLYQKSSGEHKVYDVTKVVGSSGLLYIYITGEESSSEEEPITFSGGDYFRLSRSWLIQDPYLMDGLLSEISNKTTPSGTEEFFRTDQNQIISEGSFTGVFICRETLSVGDSVSVGGEEGTIEEVNSDEEGGELTYTIKLESGETLTDVTRDRITKI